MSSFLPSCSIRKVTCAAVTKADTCTEICSLNESSCLQAEGLVSTQQTAGQAVQVVGKRLSADNCNAVSNCR